MFLYDKDMERVMQAKKREIIGELEDHKLRIMQELSGVDKITLTRLRTLLADYNRIEYNLTEKYKTMNHAIDSALDMVSNYDSLYSTHGDLHNVIAYGVIPNSVGASSSNSEIIQTLINEGKNILFPCGEFYFTNTIIIDKPLVMVGTGRQATVLKYTGTETALLVSSGNVTIEGLTVDNNTVFLNGDGSRGVVFEKMENEMYQNVSHISISDVCIAGFETSLSMNGVYFADIERVYTLLDRYGLVVNRELEKVNGLFADVESTTLNCSHLYCGGSRDVSSISDGSIGWNIRGVSDVKMNNCVSELYETAGKLENGISYEINCPYFEHTKKGLVLTNNSGYLFITSPYCNSVATETKTIIEQSGTHIVTVGGRVIGEGYSYIDKKSDNDVIIIKEPIGASTIVKSSNGWDYCGVLHIGKHFDVSVKNSTDAGVKVKRYNAGIEITPSLIKGDNAYDLMCKGNKVATVSENGFAIYSPNGTAYQIYVSDNGELTANAI